MSAADPAADRIRWNERYAGQAPSFAPHPLVTAAEAARPPAGPVLELAGGRSGSALALAEAGRAVTVVDVSDVALAQLRDEAARRGLAPRITCVCADAAATLASGGHAGRWALVLAFLFWDAEAYAAAAAAVAPGGLLGWEALRERDTPFGREAHGRDARDDGDSRGERDRPHPYSVPHGGLSARLPAGFTVLAEDSTDATTRLLARARV